MVQPVGIGATLLRVTIALIVITWGAVGTRMWVRGWLKPDVLGLDDQLMLIGLVLYTVTCSLVIACCYDGAGQYSEHLTTAEIMEGTKLFYIAEWFYAGCTVPIKSSICVCLIRVADGRRRFVWTLWALVAMQAMAAVVFFAGIANICRPITTLWGETTYGTCDTKLNSSVSFFFSAISIFTDLTLAILPAVLIWPIQMKRRLKFSVGVILSFAAFASCATIIRLRYLTLYNNSAEFMYSAGPIGLWSVVEEGIGIAAGSMPALRPLLNLRVFGGSQNLSGRDSQAPMQAHLAWAETGDGGMGHGHGHGHSGSQGHSRGHSRGASGRGAIQMNALAAIEQERVKVVVGRLSKDRDSDEESQTHILKETQVTVVTEECPGRAAANAWQKRIVNGWETEHHQ